MNRWSCCQWFETPWCSWVMRVLHFVEDCVKEYSTDSGFITSPGYPGQYPSSYRCLYVIRRPTPGPTLLQFVKFTTEHHQSCNYDYIKVRHNSDVTWASWRLRLLKTESCHDTGGCPYGNLCCRQLWQSWHHENIRFLSPANWLFSSVLIEQPSTKSIPVPFEYHHILAIPTREWALIPWWRHQVEIFSALLALYAGNSPVTVEFPSQKPVTLSFDVFFICAWTNG